MSVKLIKESVIDNQDKYIGKRLADLLRDMDPSDMAVIYVEDGGKLSNGISGTNCRVNQVSWYWADCRITGFSNSNHPGDYEFIIYVSE